MCQPFVQVSPPVCTRMSVRAVASSMDHVWRSVILSLGPNERDEPRRGGLARISSCGCPSQTLVSQGKGPLSEGRRRSLRSEPDSHGCCVDVRLWYTGLRESSVLVRRRKILLFLSCACSHFSRFAGHDRCTHGHACIRAHTDAVCTHRRTHIAHKDPRVWTCARGHEPGRQGGPSRRQHRTMTTAPSAPRVWTLKTDSTQSSLSRCMGV